MDFKTRFMIKMIMMACMSMCLCENVCVFMCVQAHMCMSKHKYMSINGSLLHWINTFTEICNVTFPRFSKFRIQLSRLLI